MAPPLSQNEQLEDLPRGASLFLYGGRVARPSEYLRACRSARRSRRLQPGGQKTILACMRIVDLETGNSYIEKRRVRYNEPGQPRALTFSCYRHYAFLGRDRTREWARARRSGR